MSRIFYSLIAIIFIPIFCFCQDKTVKDSLFVFNQDDVMIRITKFPPKLAIMDKMIFFAPHDDENTATDATLKLIETYGGTLVELRNSGRLFTESRYITFFYKGYEVRIDPNRMYSKSRSVFDEHLRKHLTRENFLQSLFTSKRAISNYTYNKITNLNQYLFSLLDDYEYIIAAHNNWSNTPQSYNLRSYYDVCSDDGRTASRYFKGKDFDVSDFFLVTDELIFDKIKVTEMNVVQQIPCPEDDGSFSVYAAYQGLNYINCEAKRGNFDQQYEMLKRLLKLLK